MPFTTQPPNLLPVDPDTGGQAYLHDWYDSADTPVAGSGDGTLTLAPDALIQTARTAGGVAASRLAVRPGQVYTFGVTADDWVAVSLRWVFGDGALSPRLTVGSTGRATVTGTAPDQAVSVVLEVHAARTRVVTDNGDGTATIQFWSDQRQGGAVLADTTPSDVPVHLSGPTLVEGGFDPGPLPPLSEDTSFGTRIYRTMPAVFRQADPPTGYTLRRWLAGAGTAVDTTLDVVARLNDLTSPDDAPDEWVPWLAQALGVPADRPLGQVRALIQAQQLAPSVGTRAGIAALARQFLTGTKIADAFPGQTAWQIMVRVRTDELPVLASVLEQQMMATGQIPAGHYITVIAGLPTWSAIDGVMTWTYKGTWADVDSIGVSGSTG